MPITVLTRAKVKFSSCYVELFLRIIIIQYEKPQNWNTLDFLMNMAFKICNFKHEPQCRVLYRLLNHSVDTLASSLPGRSLTCSPAIHYGAQLCLVSTPDQHA